MLQGFSFLERAAQVPGEDLPRCMGKVSGECGCAMTYFRSQVRTGQRLLASKLKRATQMGDPC